mgnify:FL=1
MLLQLTSRKLPSLINAAKGIASMVPLVPLVPLIPLASNTSATFRRHYSPRRHPGRQPYVNYTEDSPRVTIEEPDSMVYGGGNSQYSPLLRSLLSQPTLLLERRIEYMNLFLNIEQPNKYALFDAMGQQLGWVIERDFGFVKAIMRQVYRLHRPFTVDVMDMNGEVAMTIVRPFSWINSHIKAEVPGVGIVGESVQSWHLWRRRYNLFVRDGDQDNDGECMNQFGKIDSGFLRWEFPVFDAEGRVHGDVERTFGGLFREALTDTGVYVVRMDPTSFPTENGAMAMTPYGPISGRRMTIEEKAVMLANAVSIDFDYFSRHSGAGGGFFMFGGGDSV